MSATIDYLGGKAGYVLGSMSEGSNVLTLATADHGFRVGHTVIVECGGEAGAGARATVGVGGTWPATSFADADALIASGEPSATSDGSRPAAYAQDTGDVYYWDGDEWLQPASNFYHQSKFWPKALVAVVDAVDGATLTLDTAATVATSGAKVWRDHWRLLYTALNTAGLAIEKTAGVHAVSKRVNAGGTVAALGALLSDGVTFFGSGDECELWSPIGCQSLSLRIANADDLTVRDMLLRSNVGHGAGLLGYEGAFVVQGAIYPNPLYVAQSWRTTLERLTAVNCEWGGLQFANCQDGVMRECRVLNPEPRHRYIGVWGYSVTDCIDCNVYDCSSDSDYIHVAVTMFKSQGCTFYRFTTRNGQVETNTCKDCWYDTLDMTFEEGSATLVSERDPNFSSNQSIGWAGNAGGASFSPGGGGVRNLTWRQLGPLGEGHAWNMIVSRDDNLQPGNGDITFENWVVDGNGHLETAIIARDLGAAGALALNISNVVMDAGIELDTGSIEHATATFLRYDSETTTLGDGLNIPTITDDL